MIKAIVNDLSFLLYSVIWKIFFSIAKISLGFIKFFNAKKNIKFISDQLEDRPYLRELTKHLLEIRQKYNQCIIFYCSSAGEYEQARPIMDRLVLRPQTMILVFFHSKSGMRYVHSRQDTNQPHFYFTLVPLTDAVWDWGWIFAVLRPQGTFFVRYEIWPGFLITAHHYSKTALVAASSQGEESRLRTYFKRKIFSFIDVVYCVSETDYLEFKNRYHARSEQLIQTGDPKYDRVHERANSTTSQTTDRPLMNFLRNARCHFPNLRLFIGGSIYIEELPLILDAFKKLPPTNEWLLILAPHHVDHDNVLHLMKKCKEMGLPPHLSSRLRDPRTYPDEDCVILVDQMGFLAEIYALGHAAYVGGAYHAQIHNVLEPAIQGLSLSCGSRFNNSPEAENLVKQGLMTPIVDSTQLSKWWGSLDDKTLLHNRCRLEVHLKSMLGASDRILEHWTPMNPMRLRSESSNETKNTYK